MPQPCPDAALWSWRRALPWLIGSAALLSVISLINGFPLVFPDTGTYLRQAMRLEGILDRPPFYSIFLLPLHLGRTLWAISLFQNLIVAAVLFRTCAIALPQLGPRRLTCAVAAACLLTSLPWYSNQIMPDIFTPLIVLLVFCAVLGWEALSRWERIVIPLALLAMISFHTSNPLFAVTTAAAAALLALLRGDRLKIVAGRSGLVAGLALLAVCGQALYGYAVIGRVTPAPAAPFFTLARLLYDGPARDYLAQACPGAGYFLCNYQQDFKGDSDNFLWDPDSPLAALEAARHEDGALNEAAAIVGSTVRRFPLAVAENAAGNAARQFVSFATVITNCPCFAGKIGHVIPELFPAAYGSYRASLQNQNKLPWGLLTLVDWCALGASVVALGAILLAAPSWLRGEPGRLLALIGFALVVNAVLMGALSRVTDRYQARIIWLVPFFAMALVLSHVEGKRFFLKKDAKTSAT
jgi:hypothetical protein